MNNNNATAIGINEQNQDDHGQQQELFYNAILNNNINWIKSFLKNPSTSSLYFQFKYSIEKNYLPNDCHVTPIIIAILHNKLSIVQLLIQHQIQQQCPSTTMTAPTTPTSTQPLASFNPSTYKEHGIPLFFYAIASESNEMMDYILSLYSTTPTTPTSASTSTSTTSTSSPTSSTHQQTINIDSILSDALLFATEYTQLVQIRYLVEHYKCNILIQDSSTNNILHFATSNNSNSIEIVDYLMSLDGVNNLLEQRNSSGATPLAAAVFNHNRNLFKHLISQYNVDFNTVSNNNHNLLHVAIADADDDNVDLNFIDDIIQLNPTFITSTNTNGYTPFHDAIYFNKLRIVQHLIQHHNVDPLFISTINNQTILHAAALSKTDSIAMFAYLLSFNGVINLLENEDDDGETPLLQLASENKPNSFKYLVEKHNANVECQNNDGETVAHMFSFDGNIEMIDFIHNINPDLIYQQHNGGLSPLMFAISNNQLSLVKHLIKQYNADLNHITNSGASALHLACRQSSIELVDYIINLLGSLCIESMNAKGRTPLFYACSGGNIDIFHHLINQHNANPFVVDHSNFHIMHHATDSNNTELIKSIATIFQNHQPPTTLQFTLPNGYQRLTGEWFDDELSPLHLAIERSNLDSVKQLVRLKANISTISQVDSEFNTILQYSHYYAHDTNNYSIFQYLLSDECLQDWNNEELKFNGDDGKDEDDKYGDDNENDDGKDEHDETTINTIYRQQDPIQSQLEVHYPDLRQHTLLLYAASKCDLTAMKLLIERNANIYALGNNNMNILHILLCSSEQDQQSQDKLLNIINYLFSLPTIDKTKLFTQKTSSSGATPLLLAAQESSFLIVQQLIQFNANINDIDLYRFNILHYAAFNKKFTIINHFFQHYPQSTQQQSSILNSNGSTPFHISTFLSKSLQQEQSDESINHINTMNDDGIGANAINIEFNFYNQDITTFIQYDPTLLLQTTTSKATILHIAVQAEHELPTRLAGLIESIIDHTDLIL